MKRTAVLFAFLLLLTACNPSVQSTVPERPRTIITTDGEVDDMDSFIRMLLHSNEFQVEGLVYSSSQWHYKGDGKGTLFTSEMPGTARRYGERTDLRWPGTTWMQEFIDKYATVYMNLKEHDGNFPSPDYLRSIVKTGNINFEGDMKEATEGSDFIKQVLLDEKEGPVYVEIWGGTNTLARALKSIEEEYRGTSAWDEIYKKVSDKTFIYTILDQDATYTRYVAPTWPDIRVIYNSSQFWSFAYAWPMVVTDKLKTCMGGKWFAEHIKFNHGSLLENYYLWGDGSRIEGDPEHTQGSMEVAAERHMDQYDFISEGDSPSWFYLMDFGLRSTEDPTYGGLGGRFRQSESNPRRWEDGRDLGDLNPETGKVDPSYPQVRWIGVLQNEFAARADWCLKPYNEANHAPVVMLKCPEDIEASPGSRVDLSCTVGDPDHDGFTVKWWPYMEAGTCRIPVQIEDAASQHSTVTVPEDAEPGQTIHLILEVKDDGTPVLTRFARVIVTVD